MSDNRLGKGLAALISSETYKDSGAYNEKFDITNIIVNPYQPRMNIEPDELIELADSIKQHGVIQPLIISKDKTKEDKYFLIAGERRLRASQLAGLKTVPVVIKEASPQEMLEMALIENIQRRDLNPVEEALAFKQLQDEFGLTHEQVATKVGVSRVSITNKIRLLSLPDVVKEYTLNGQLSEGHARALLGLTDESTVIATANIVIKKSLSVRDTEELVRKINFNRDNGKTKIDLMPSENRQMIEKLSEKLGYTAKVVNLGTGGKIVVRFQDDKEFKEIMKRLI